VSTKYEIVAKIYDKRGRVLSVGRNSYVKTHPLQAKFAREGGFPDKKYLHAEVAAIARCKSLVKAHRIFVSRYDKRGQGKLAAPCEVCQRAIAAAGIKLVEYTI
jgi:deoxycytidylate deaminase